MLLIVAGYTHYTFYQRNSVDIARAKFESFLSQTETEINDVVNDAAFLQSIVHLYDEDLVETRNFTRANELVAKSYTIFFYNLSNQLLFWSNDKAPQPDLSSFNFSNPYYLKHQNIYRTLYFTRQIGNENYRILACIPVRLGAAAEPSAGRAPRRRG